MIYKVKKEASWLVDFPENIYSDSNYQKIYQFFVVYSIVDGLSARGKNLEKDYGWNTPWIKPYFLNKQLKNLASSKKLLFSADAYEQKQNVKNKITTMAEALEKANLIVFPEYDEEKICIYNSKKNHILSTFAHIRNSFAHCRFNIVDRDGIRVYCFEDVEPNKDENGNVKVSGRIVLFEKTLISWIDLICGGEKEYKEK